MNRENQIEKMAKLLIATQYETQCFANCIPCGKCMPYRYSEALYDKGYREQIEGEWITNIEQCDGEDGEFTARKVFVCSKCGRTERQKEPFCNCGAKMKGETDGLDEIH